MDIDVALGIETVKCLLLDFTPIRMHMAHTDDDRRWLELDRPTEITLVPGRGIRAVSSGKVRYAIGGFNVPLSIRRVQVLLEPELQLDAAGGQRLDFKLHIESADLQKVPDVIDRALVNKVNEALDPRIIGMSWNIAATLNRALRIPERLEPLHEFLMRAERAQIIVTGSEIRLKIGLALSISRTSPLPVDD